MAKAPHAPVYAKAEAREVQRSEITFAMARL